MWLVQQIWHVKGLHGLWWRHLGVRPIFQDYWGHVVPQKNFGFLKLFCWENIGEQYLTPTVLKPLFLTIFGFRGPFDIAQIVLSQ